MMISYAEIINLLVKDTGFKRSDITEVIHKYEKYVALAISTGKDVKTPLGIYRLQWNNKMHGYDMFNQKELDLPQRKKLKFYPSAPIKNAISQLNATILERYKDGVDVRMIEESVNPPKKNKKVK